MNTEKKHNTTILKKLIFTFGGLSLILFLIFGGSLLYVTSSSFTELTENMNLQLAASRGDEISRWLEGHINVVKGFSDLTIMKTGSLEEAGAYLEDRHNSLNKEFAMVFISDDQGNYHSSLGADGNISSRDYFQDLKNGALDVAISNPVVSKSMGIPIFVIAYRVSDGNGDFK